MKKLLFLLTLLCLEKALQAQRQPYIYTIKADSVLITNSCDTAELILENHTQNVPGFLFNKGGGRTEFRRPLQKINDTLFLVGADSLKLRNAWLQGGNAFGSTGILGTTDNNDIKFITNNTEQVRITSSGYIGIGTATPAHTLDIVDTPGWGGSIVNVTSSAANSWPRYQVTCTNSGVNAGAGMLMVNDANQILQLFMASTHNGFTPAGAEIRSAGPGGLNIVADYGCIAFGKSPYIGRSEFARFLNNGYFGIGTQTPVARLHVIGTGMFTDTLTATTMDIADSSNRVATTAYVKHAIGAPALPVISAGTTDVTATAGAFIRLPDLSGTGSHSVILPAASSYTGQRIYLWNMNSSSNSWTFSSAITLPNGTTSTSIPNQANIELISDGSVWLKWN
jgi:hypothetical protein